VDAAQKIMKQIPLKVLQLLPSLSSTVDGEIVAAANAITRVLKSNGQDWHDLVEAVAKGSSTAKETLKDRHESQHGQMINKLYYSKVSLSLEDMTFISKMKTRLDMGLGITDIDKDKIKRIYFSAGS
jgi:hypothetical protein